MAWFVHITQSTPAAALVCPRRVRPYPHKTMNHPFKGLTRTLARPVVLFSTIAALVLSPGGLGLMSSGWAQEINNEGAEVLTRGPVHEAFAGTIIYKATPGLVVPKAPPAEVEEIPPDQRPEGANVTWIPGYWAWDDEAGEFLWVSGIWRNLPPGRQWIPGYWWESGEDYQWISGYWADAAAEEVEYLDEPPASLEAGPNISAPTRNHSWIPGTWRWSESRYIWQPGYWYLARPDWVWVPSYYTRAPLGYIYVDGYYDYDVPRRGMVFAPVRFSGSYYSRPDYYYRPTTVISITALLDHLFLRPRSRHYYFGDYYAPEYRRSGYYASYSYYSGGYGYDPIYAHQRWTHRDDDRWERRSEDNFSYYRDHKEARPPRTLAALNAFYARPDKDRRVEAGYATRLDQLVTTKDTRLKFKPVNETERKNFAQRGREIREFGDQRRKQGDRVAGTREQDKTGKEEKAKGGRSQGGPTRVKIPKSPVMAKVAEAASREDTPPDRPKVSRPDEKSAGKRDPKQRPGTPDGQRDLKPEPGRRDQTNPDTKGDPKDSRRSEPKPAPRPESGPRKTRGQPPEKERLAIPKAEPQPEPKVSPKREPNARPGDSQKREPKAEPRGEPKRDPKVEPRREPTPQPKRQPKAEPRPQPKAAPRPQPKAEPRPQPKAEPRKQPKTPAPVAAAPKKSSGKPEEKEEKDKRR